MNTKERGDLTEAIAIAELKRHGCTVSVSVGETARYDLLVDADGELLRVQCKTGWKPGAERLVFKTCSTDYNASGHHANRGYQGQVDAFLVRNPNDDSLYLIDIEDAPSREMTLRLNMELGPNQNDASEYRLGTVLP